MAIRSTRYVELTAKVACTGLVIASAGFGAVYAYSVGIQHGIVLAGLTVLFAVALELVKPLAIQQAFTSRSLSLAALGAVAVAYSLTAELGLMASSRGDLAAVRASQAFLAHAGRDRYQRAQQELSSLKPARPVAELEALVAGARDHCRIQVASGVRQTTCTKPPALLAELGRAKRRAELEAITAETAIAPVKLADPGSTAMATYLGALGITVMADTVATWLNLVPVLALELGSALAVVLVSSVAPRQQESRLTQQVTQPTALEKPALALPVAQQTATERDRVASQIVSHLKANGGSARASHRSLGKMLGADRNTVSRALHSLAGAGLIAMAATKTGTVLRLIG